MLMKIRNTMKRKENQKGFTLVELVIVMAILAILAAIAVPRFGASLTTAKEQAHNANVMMLEKAAELAVLNGDIVSGDDAAAIQTALEGKYIDQYPEMPLPSDHDDYKASYSVTISIDSGDVTNQLIVTVDPGRI